MRYILTFCFSIGFVAHASAVTINLTSCDVATVQKAVDAAADGDVINLPACSVQWSAGLVVNKSITIQGAGMNNTVITSAMAPGGSQNQLTPLIRWQTKATGNTPAGLSKLANLELDDGNGSQASCCTPLLQINGSSGRMVIQGVRLEHRRQEALYLRDYVRGVFSGGEILAHRAFQGSVRVEHNAWMDDSSTCSQSGCGDRSWAEPTALGSDQAFYIEGSLISGDTGMYTWALDGWNGMRVVFRFNKLHDLSVGNHGTETPGRPRGARKFEYYSNIISYDGYSHTTPLATRGGTGVVFDNTSTTSGSGSHSVVFGMDTYRSDPVSGATPYWPFGRCGEQPISSITRSGNVATATAPGWDGRGHWLTDGGGFAAPSVIVSGASDNLYNGTFTTASIPSGTTFTYTMSGTPSANASGTLKLKMAYDQNSDATGYLCLDQSGAGQTAVKMTGDPPQKTYIGQAREPIYVWGNTLNSNQSNTGEFNGTDAMQPNRDYYDENDAFTGATGVGRGPIASRPTSCTTGVAYWATNEGEWNATNGPTPDGRLYKCTASNTWTLFYTPLAYPHPLISGQVPTNPIPAPTSVQNVRVIGG